MDHLQERWERMWLIWQSGWENCHSAESVTRNLRIHGYQEGLDINDPRYWYGSDRDIILELIDNDADMGRLSVKNLIF